MKSGLKEIPWIIIISLLVMTLLFLRTNRMTYEHPNFNEPWDHHQYIKMAENHPPNDPEAPFAWRILNPLLASALPFNIQINFQILNFIFLWLTSILAYIMLHKLDFSHTLSLTGMLFFLSLGWATKLNLYDFWLTDPLAFAFSTAAFLAIVTRKDLLLMIFLVVGVTAKENVLFIAPLYYTFNTRRLVDKKIFIRCLIISVPALLILLLLRIFIPVTNQEYHLLRLLQTIGLDRLQGFSLKDVWSYSIGTFGISLLVLPLFAIRKNILLFLKFLPLTALTYLSLLVATNTWRLLIFAFPAVLTMAATGIQTIAKKTGINEQYFLYLPLLLLLLLMIQKDWMIVPSWIEALLILLFLICMGTLKWFLGRQQAESMVL